MKMPSPRRIFFTNDRIIIMPKYISILRGINVSGQKMIRMEDLKSLYEGIGFSEVITYIQSGNVIFETDRKETIPALVKKIENAIEEKYHFHVPVIIRTVDELHHILLSNPFLKEKKIDQEKLHVTFLDEIPSQATTEKVQAIEFPPDRFRIIAKEVYLYCPGGYGGSKISNSFFENKLKIKATTRNWRTVGKLAELAGD